MSYKKLKIALKDALSVTVSVTTALWLVAPAFVGGVVPTANAAASDIVDGSLIRANGTFDVYIVKIANGHLSKRLILNPEVFNSYGHLSWSDVMDVSQAVVDSYTTSNVVRVDGDTKVWQLNPNGDTGTKQWITTADVFLGLGYSWDSVYTINQTEANLYTTGADITSSTGGTTGGTTPPAPTGTGLTVALSSTTPASNYVAVGSAFTDFADINLTAGSQDVTVNSVTVTRQGLGADSDVNNVYLFNGNNRLTLSGTLGSGKVTFTNSNGLFVVPAGSTYTLSIKADLNSGAGSKTYQFGIASASDIQTSGSAAVNGTFPLFGNIMSGATVSNPSIATLRVQAISVGTTINAGTTNQLVGQFQFQANNSNVNVSQVMFTEVGSINPSMDLANLKLFQGSTQVGQTLDQPNQDGSMVFDFSNAPLTITSGQNVTFSVYADVLGTPNRYFTVTIQRNYDVIATDTTYNAGILTTSISGSFPIQQPAVINVQAGNLVVNTNANSPTGNISTSINDVVLAKFDVLAAGEPVKLFTMPVRFNYTGSMANDNSTGDNNSFANLRLVTSAGIQLGTTYSTPSSASGYAHTAGPNSRFDFTFGSSASPMNFILAANTTTTLEVRADILSSMDTGVTAFRVDLISSTNNAQGTISLSNTSTTTNIGRTLTVVSTPFSHALNSGLGNSTYVKGATGVRTGSFVLTAGAGEGILLTNVTVKSNATAATTFQNMKVLVNGGPFGITQGSLQNNQNYTFSGSSQIMIPVGGTAVVDVYEDVQNGAATGTLTPAVVFINAVGSGAQSGTARTSSGGNTNGQSLTIATSGSLAISVDSGTLAASNIAMGATNITFGSFKLTTGTNEGANITSIKVTDTFGGLTANAATALSNIKLFDNQTQIGSAIASLTSGAATFQFSPAFHMDANTVKTIAIKADVNAYNSTASSSGSTHTFSVAANGDVVGTGDGSGANLVPTGAPAAGNAQSVFRTSLNVTLDGSSPSGSRTVSATDQIALYDFTAGSNFDALVQQFSVTLSSAVAVTNTMRVRDVNGYISGSVAGVAATSQSGVIGIAPTAFTAITSGDLTINGTSVGAVTDGTDAITQAANLVTAINTVTSTTGVTAALVGTTLAANKVALYRATTAGDITIGFAGATATLATTGLTAGTTHVVVPTIAAAPTAFTAPGDTIADGDLQICGGTGTTCTNTSVGAVTAGGLATLQTDALVAAINSKTSITGVTAARTPTGTGNTYVLIRATTGHAGVTLGTSATLARTGLTANSTQSTTYVVALPSGYTVTAGTTRVITLEVDTSSPSWNTSTNQDAGAARITAVTWNDQGGSSANIPSINLPVVAGTLLY